MSECKCEHWQVCDKCMPERWKPKVARPHEQLINELLNPNTPKTEREHAAAREIEIFRNDLTIPEMRTGIALQLREIESLRARLAASEARAERYRRALLKLACLGNGDCYGNSHGNVIAQEALAEGDAG